MGAPIGYKRAIWAGARGRRYPLGFGKKAATHQNKTD